MSQAASTITPVEPFVLEAQSPLQPNTLEANSLPPGATKPSAQAQDVNLPNEVPDSASVINHDKSGELSTLTSVDIPEKSTTEKAADNAATAFHVGEQLHKVQEQVSEKYGNDNTAAVKVGSIMTQVFGSEVDVAQFKAAGISAIGTLASLSGSIPIFGPSIGGLVKGLVDIIDKKKKLDIKWKRMAPRVNQVILVMVQVQQNAPEKCYEDVKEKIDAVAAILKKILEFFEMFFKKGYFRKLVATAIKATALDEMDRDLNDALQNFSLSAINMNLQMQKQNDRLVKACYEHLLETQAAQTEILNLKAKGSGNASGSELSEDFLKNCKPELLGMLAKSCGLPRQEMREELQSILKDVSGGFSKAMNAAAENIQEKLGSQIHATKQKMEKEMQNLEKEMHNLSKKIMKEGEKNQNKVLVVSDQVSAVQSSITAQNKRAEDRDVKMDMKMDRLLEKIATQSNDAGMAEALVFSSKSSTAKLGSLCRQAILSDCFVPDDHVLHFCGIGGNLPDLNGRNGSKGCENYSPDGHPGAAGGDGAVGEMGGRGLDCDDFHIEMMTVTRDDSTKEVAISHSGQKGRVQRFEVTDDQFFYIDGSGGQGGAGGDGGDGEVGMPNQNGAGGKGGRSAKGGRGGPGGAGARVVLTTNDPLLLMRVLVDCTGGEGGVGGYRGEPGQGGTGSPPGRTGKLPQSYAMDGEPGSHGQVAFRILSPFDGLGPREPPEAPGEGEVEAPTARVQSEPASTAGTVRRLSSCSSSSLDPSWSRLVESGGEPYRLIFHDQGEDDGGCETTNYGPSPTRELQTINVERGVPLAFVYGEEVVLGPYKPTNSGGLSCPNSKLRASLLDEDEFEIPECQKESEEFAVLRAASEVRYGECFEDAKKLTLRLPDWEEWGKWNELGDESSAIRIDQHAGDFPSKTGGWSQRTRTFAYAKASWTVDGIEFLPYEEERANGMLATESTQIVTEISVDLPVCLARLDNGRGLLCPKHMAIGHDPEVHVTLALGFYAPFDHAHFQHAVRFCSDGFQPVVKVPGGSTTSVGQSGRLPPPQVTAALCRVEGCVAQTYLQPQQYSLALPATPEVAPGKSVCLRPELRRLDSRGVFRVVSYGPAEHIRLTPPPPAQHAANAAKQVVMFTDRHTRESDYPALEAACKLLQLEPVFLDAERFRDAQGNVDAALWRAQRGAATLIWVPTPADAHRLPAQELQDHLAKGGAVVSNLGLEAANPPASGAAQTRQLGVSLAFTEDDSHADTSVAGLVVGKAVWPTVFALLRSRGPAEQVRLLAGAAPQMGYTVSGVAAETFSHGAAGDGCCGNCCERCPLYGPQAGCGAPAFRGDEAQHPPRSTGAAQVTVREALLSSVAQQAARERRAAAAAHTLQPRPFTDALLAAAMEARSKEAAATWLGVMEAAALHSWGIAGEEDELGRPPPPHGVCEALSMSRDRAEPFLAIKVAWLTCRQLAAMPDALAVCSRLRAVADALSQTEQQAAAAEQRRRNGRTVPRGEDAEGQRAPKWTLADDQDGYGDEQLE